MDSLKDGEQALPQPESLTSLKEIVLSFRNLAGALGDTQVMTIGPNIEGWIGQSAGAFAGEAQHIQNAVRKLQNVFSDAIKALNEYQSTYDTLANKISTHQHNWNENIYRYNSSVTFLKLQSSPKLGKVVHSVDLNNAISNLKSKLDSAQMLEAQAYNRTVEGIDVMADSVSIRLASLIDAVVPLTGPDGTRRVPSRADIGLSLFGDTKGILAAQSKWAAAEADAPDAAALINQIDDKTKLPTEAALKEFNAQYGSRMASDPYFATMVMREIGVEKLYDIGLRVENATLTDSHAALLKVFVSNMGAGLILATGGSSNTAVDVTNGFKAVDNVFTTDGKKSVRQWRSEFQAALNKYGQTAYDSEGKEVSRDNYTDKKLFGYEILGQYLGLGARAHPELSLGDHFLNGFDSPGEDEKKNSVARAMAKWNAENPQNFRLQNLNMRAGYSNSSSKPAGIFGDGLSFDYLQNMYEAMDGALDKAPAREFMTSDLKWVDKWPDNEPGEARNRSMNMTRYLVGNRTQVGKAGDFTLYWAEDRGEALGALIDDLSSDTSDVRSATIVQNYLKGYCDGLDRNYDGSQWGNRDKLDGQDIFGHENSALRSHTGGILKEYISDIVEEKKRHTGVNGAPGGSWDIRDGRYHLVFDEDLAKKMHDEIETDNSGKKTVVETNKFFVDIAHDKKLVKELSKHMINNLTTDYYKAYTAYGDDSQKDRLKEYVVENYTENLKALKKAELSAGIDESNSTVGKVMNFFTQINNYAVGNIPVVGGTLQGAGNSVIQLCDSNRIDAIVAKHSSDPADVDITVNNATNVLNDVQIENEGKVQSPIVRKYKNPVGTLSVKSVPGIKEYVDMLPNNEKFLDENGNEIPAGDLSKEQKLAKKRFINSKWNGQG